MTGEGIEYRGRRKEGHRETSEGNESLESEEAERAEGLEAADEGREKESTRESKESEEEEIDRKVREIVENIRREYLDKEEQAESDEGPVEAEVKDAVSELEEEEEERRQRREEYEARMRAWEAEQDRMREARETTADEESYEDEEPFLDVYETYGHDREDLKERWRETFRKEVEEHIEGKKDLSEDESEDTEEHSGGEAHVESRASYSDGSGLVYELRTEGGDTGTSKTESDFQESADEEQCEGTEQRLESKKHEQTEEVQSEIEESEEQTHGKKMTEEAPTKDVSEGEPEAKPPEARVERSRRSKLVEETHEDTEHGLGEEEPLREAPEPSSGHMERESHEESNESGEADRNEVSEEFRARVRDILEEADLDDGYRIDTLSGERVYRGSEFFHESEEERTRRRLRELWSALTEEEREYFKEWVRSRLQSEEDLDELIERLGERLGRCSTQDEDVLRRFLRGEEEEPPVLLRGLLALETESEWTRLVAEEAYLRIREKQMAEDAVRERELSEETEAKESIPETHEAFLELLENHSHLKKQKRYKKGLAQVRVYYLAKADLAEESFEGKSRRELWREFSGKYDVPVGTFKGWFGRGALPRLLRDMMGAENPETRRHKGTGWERLREPESWQEYLDLLSKHPYLRETKGFTESHEDVRQYFLLMDLKKTHPKKSMLGLSKMSPVSNDTARAWLAGRSRPKLLTRLLKNEAMRRAEAEATRRVGPGFVPPSEVYHLFRPLKKKPAQTVEKLAGVLRELSKRPHPVVIVPLKPYNRHHGPRWLLRIAKTLRKDRFKLEKELNGESEKRPAHRLRVCVTDNKLYLWRDSVSEWDYLNLFSNELFFFSKKMHTRLVRDARDRLGLNGDYLLSDLIRQAVDYKQKGREEGRLISHLFPTSRNLRGDVLRFLLDAQGMRLEDIIDYVHRIGVGRQIVKPRILDEHRLKVLLARLFAIVCSDGHIEPEYRVTYYEDDPNRRRIVRHTLRELGHMPLSRIKNHKGEIGGFRMPAVIGRLLARIGMPVGDKVLQGVKLPDFIMHGPPDFKLAYAEELIPEEGSVGVTKKGNLLYAWSRAVVLYDGIKGPKYGFEQKASHELAMFVKENGTEYVREYDSGVVEVYYIVRIGELEQLMKSKDNQKRGLAHLLESVVRANSSKHIEDEKHILESCGIMLGYQSPSEIRYSVSSDRLSLKWNIKTNREEDAILWSLIAPPRDRRKRRRALNWLQAHPKKVKTVRGKIIHSQESIRRILEEASHDAGRIAEEI